MSKSPKDTKLDTEAWRRFERAVDVVAKSPPQPKKKATSKQRIQPRKAKTKPGK